MYIFSELVVGSSEKECNNDSVRFITAAREKDKTSEIILENSGETIVSELLVSRSCYKKKWLKHSMKPYRSKS
jgi:hypothetical protein